MENRQTRSVMLALLGSVYRKNLITEDMYNHALNNLPELPEDSEETVNALEDRCDDEVCKVRCHIRHNAAAKEVNPHGHVPN